MLAPSVSWHNADSHLTLVADSAQNVYGSDISNIYLLSNGTITTYLTAAEAATALGLPTVGPSGAN